MKRIILSIVLLAIGLVTWSAAQETDELKARFRERLPVLNALKDKAIVGENNKGFLEFLGKSRKNEAVVNAENTDRRQLYDAIAAGTGTTPELVGQRRALQIAAQEPKGRMVQNEKGEWKRKP